MCATEFRLQTNRWGISFAFGGDFGHANAAHRQTLGPIGVVRSAVLPARWSSDPRIAARQRRRYCFTGGTPHSQLRRPDRTGAAVSAALPAMAAGGVRA